MSDFIDTVIFLILIGAVVAAYITRSNQTVSCAVCNNTRKRKEMAGTYHMASAFTDSSIPKEILMEWKGTALGNGLVCKSCFDQAFRQLERQLQYAGDMECFPATYKGRVRVVSSTSEQIETGYYSNRDEALYVLKCRAALHSKNVVTQAHYDYKTESQGNYYYKVWRYTGAASVLQK